MAAMYTGITLTSDDLARAIAQGYHRAVVDVPEVEPLAQTSDTTVGRVNVALAQI